MPRHGSNFDPNAPVQRPPAPASPPSNIYSAGGPTLPAPVPAIHSVPSYHSQTPSSPSPVSSHYYQGQQPAPQQHHVQNNQYAMAQQPYHQQGPMVVNGGGGGGNNGYVYNDPGENKQPELVYNTRQIEQPQTAIYDHNVQGANYNAPVYQATIPIQPGQSSYSTARAEKEFPTHLKSSKHIFSSHTDWRWTHTHHYKKPGYVFQDQRKFRHRDFAGRVVEKQLSDRYLHHDDGHLRKLIVQATDEIFEASSNATWQRTYVRKQASIRVRLATWVIDFSYDPESWHDWWIQVLRALPAALAMTLAFWDLSISGERKYDGYYAPIAYNYHLNAKTWSNHLENRVEGVPFRPRRVGEYRVLKPRYLCFLRSAKEKAAHGLDIRLVSDWEANEGLHENLSYLFVAYSTEHFDHDSEDDLRALHAIAEHACRQAGLPAYWIACSCMDPGDQLEADVYRISDILRGAQELVIAVGHSSTRGDLGIPDTDALLRQWGSRMWTFPEVLLSPGKHISVYTRGGNLNSPLVISKNQFAGRVWADTDAETSRQLIDNFIGNLDLSRLELAVLLLKCLYSRHTTQYFNGDQAYALMGLLRMRPEIDRTDSDFQAFARLSLANDSDQLLERYLCTLPLTRDQYWHNMEDAYQSSLWDITPTCQIAAICENDTVILDGAHGGSIRWKSFYRLNYSRNLSWRREFAALAMQFNGVNFILACILLGASASAYRDTQTTLVIIGLIFLGLFLYFWLNTPRLVRTLLGGKFTDIQAAFFGIEGHLNAPTIERTLFGGNFGRLGWSVNGSPLSRSVLNEFGERVGIDPAKDPEVLQKIHAAKFAKPGDMRIFTLVDTYNMELTLFEAVRPPTCVLLCGAEGGMQRAIACSYDWTTETMYRETVLRMQTTTLNRMDRVPRVRLGIQRPDLPVRPAVATAV